MTAPYPQADSLRDALVAGGTPVFTLDDVDRSHVKRCDDCAWCRPVRNPEEACTCGHARRFHRVGSHCQACACVHVTLANGGAL